MQKLSEVKERLSAIIDLYQGSTALYLSGGNDSLLLLHLLLDIGKPFSIVSFIHSFSKEQQRQIDRLIYENNLLIFSYPPVRQYFVGDGKERVSIIEEYAFLDGNSRAFIRDVEHNPTHCIHDTEFAEPKTVKAPVGFQLNLFGVRKTDYHYTIGKIAKEAFSKNGKFLYLNPLWEFTRKDVSEGLKNYNQAKMKLDTGTNQLCTNCLLAKGKVFCPKQNEMIEPFSWNSQENLNFFKNRFNY